MPLTAPQTAFKPELLLPAGTMEKLRSALLYGADAVYLGGPTGNLRASAEGFDATALREALVLAREHGASIYYCLNSLPMQDDLAPLPAVIEDAAAAGVHAFIIADPGVLRLAQRYAPQVPIHLSTQANTTNAEAVAFWADMGVSRVNLARELTCRDIHAVRKALPDMELEVFLHGAMCLAVSGQCLLSAWLNNRSGNQGRCTQPCRFAYRAVSGAGACPGFSGVDDGERAALVVEEALRDGQELWGITRSESYSEFWAPDDLCLLPYLPWFITNRITSLKVEGRMKGSSYVAHVADAYRTAIDAAVAEGAAFAYARYLPDLARTATRPLATGFFLPGKRRHLSGEGFAPAPNATGVSGSYKDPSIAPRPLLARFAEPAAPDGSAWHMDVRGMWDATRPAEVMLTGQRRPALIPGTYAFENHRGEKTSAVNTGTRATVFFGPQTDPEIITSLKPGMFVRGVV